MYSRSCKVCKTKFKTLHPKYLCCCTECTMINKVNKRYERESGDWTAYFKQLLSKKENTDLTPIKLINILNKQKGKCILSGVPLTCEKVRGVTFKTNASIDRIVAGGKYRTGNVQLVCRAVNSFRNDMTVNDFITWCKKITNHTIYQHKKNIKDRFNKKS